jgi:hypothetical protein
VRFTADKSAISFEYMEGNGHSCPGSGHHRDRNSPDTLYIGALADGTGIDPNITIVISGTTGTFQHLARARTRGRHLHGPHPAHGCSDSACNRQVGNSPLFITYTTRVQPRLKTAPASVTLNAVSGNTVSAVVNVTLPWQQTTQTAYVETAPSGCH